ncbi:PAS domain-containing sensor histidine kinase [Nocardiopsis terrae]|uniref:histidine kinase n=1 Tax=Nocardiopsis terrae TaxID=372655 RepID=A0ABR9HEG8_9ACTN|nr:HAMP domain-containing sensor histidine kinase [Nocardiopsis terrae]MBE1457420.1 signal transduction histidine kinase [Nocardiopsis terrae]GHC92099.1 PAS domain-containing sensor histidine kinase [Nocardiopsis terrae]
MGSGRQAGQPAEDSDGAAAQPSRTPVPEVEPGADDSAGRERTTEPESRTGDQHGPAPALWDVDSALGGAVGPSLHADDLPDGVVVADARGRVVLFNVQAAQLIGVPAEAALGRDYRAALPLNGLDGNDWWESSDPYGGDRDRTRQPERVLCLPDEREILVAARYVRARPGGALVRLVVTLRDASARAERSRADLVSEVAHELRSPLTSVKGFTSTLLNKWERLSDKQKLFMLETVNADADRVTRLIHDLLDVSRIESGRLEVRRQVVDLPAMVRRVVASRVASGEAEERFRVETHGELSQMWLDADKLEQILANLVENGVRHGAGTVSIVIEPCEGGAAVSVRDEGQGIAPETIPRVFRQFWRSKRRGGTGLGLFIVKGLVEAHGGTITVGRAPNGGAEFRFTMPAGTPEFV